MWGISPLYGQFHGETAWIVAIFSNHMEMGYRVGQNRPHMWWDAACFCDQWKHQKVGTTDNGHTFLWKGRSVGFVALKKKSATGIFSASQKSSSPKRPLRNKKNNRSMAPVASRSDDRQGDPGWCSDFRRLVSFKSSKVSETDGDSPDQQISPDPMDRWRRSVSSQQGPSLNLRVWINTY